MILIRKIATNSQNKMKITRIILICIGLFTNVFSYSQSPKEYYQKAKVNYNNADFKSCILFLEKSKNTLGHTNPRIESLLTSAYYYNGDIVKAKISYDRLLKIASNQLKQSPAFAEYKALGQLIDAELQREEKRFHENKQIQRKKAMEQYLKPLALEEAPNLFEVTDCTNSNCSYGKTEEIKYEDCRKCNGSGKGPAIRIEGKYGPTYVRDDCYSCKGVGARNYVYSHTCTTCKGESKLFTYTGDYPFSDREIKEIVRNNKSNIIANSKSKGLNKMDRTYCTAGDCKNGRGTYKSDNDYLYIGSFVNGKKHGKGKCFFADKKIYSGEWKDDKMDGYGIYTWPSGSVYEGELTDNNPNGVGTYTWPNGQVYTGDWKNGTRSGQGELIISDRKYKGAFKNDKYNGQGIMTWAEGHVYKGEWKDGHFNGVGTYTWSDGMVYTGEWKDDKENGQGKMIYTKDNIYEDGDIYEGEWKDSKRNGQGKFTYANGEVYEGEWKDGKRNGQGTYTWPSGQVYTGEFKNDKKEGYGKMRYPDESTYEGEWKNGEKHGKGFVVDKGKTHEEEWSNGEKILNNTNKKELFLIEETRPEFSGGMTAFGHWLSQNLKYPKEARLLGVEGTVIAQFTVLADGSITSIKILEGIGAGCDEEVIRLLKICPKWIPGEQNGKKVKLNMIIPIDFKLS